MYMKRHSGSAARKLGKRNPYDRKETQKKIVARKNRRHTGAWEGKEQRRANRAEGRLTDIRGWSWQVCTYTVT